MVLAFYTSATKELKLPVRKFLVLIPLFVVFTGANMVRSLFDPFLPFPPILNTIKLKTLIDQDRKIIIIFLLSISLL